MVMRLKAGLNEFLDGCGRRAEVRIQLGEIDDVVS